MSNNEEIIIGLDVGSSKIRVVVGQKTVNNLDKKIRIIGAVEQSAEGINKGVITNIEDAVSSVSAVLEKAERVTGLPIKKVWVGISGNYIISQPSRGVIAISRSNGEITEDDVERAIEAARNVSLPPNYEIVHVIPRNFIVDNQDNISDPVGMTGIRLEVEAQIIQGISSQIKNLTKCIYRTGRDIEDMVLSILAAGDAVLSSRQKELGVVLINIGAATTSLAVYEEGDVLHTASLPLGSDHITADIAIGLRINIDLAEKLKLEYGYACPKDIDRHEEITIKEAGSIHENKVSRRYVAEIIEARVEEIFSKIDQELIKLERSGKLPAGAVLIGGGSELPQIIELAKKKLRLPASLGQAHNVESAVDKVNTLSYITAIGLVLWGGQFQANKDIGNGKSIFRGVGNVFKKMFNGFKK